MEYGFATPFAASQTHVEYDFLREIKNAGYDYVELPGTLVGSLNEEDFHSLTEFLSDIGLRCKKICALLPAALNCFSTDRGAFCAYLDKLFDRFGVLQVEGVGFGSGAARRAPEDWAPEERRQAFAEVLQSVFLPKLIEKNMVLCVEPLRAEETNLISTVAEATDVVRQLNDPHFGVVADTLHMMTMREDPQTVASEYMPWIQHFHISELERALPAYAYSEGCEAFVRAFRRCGYDKSVSFETKCNNSSELKSALELIKTY